MPRKLTLSIMSQTRSFLTGLDQFGKQNGMDIARQELDYITGWSDFVRMTIHGGSPDVSEMGSTWINDFAAMNVLRPFSPSDLRSLGSNKIFVQAQLHSTISSGIVWSIPWMTDLRLVFYRRDLLSKAGIEEQNAFQTPERFEQTLQQLQDAGISTPFSVPTQSSYLNVHNLAMWVWQAGENLVDVQNKVILLDRPRVRSAILSFLNLYRFMPKGTHRLDGNADQRFNAGEVAVIISGPWAINSKSRSPEVAANMGLAIPLGCSYIGGSNLVIWKQGNQVPDSLALIAYLTSREFFQANCSERSVLFPGRLDSLEFFPMPDPSFYPLVQQALKTGRSLPSMDLWGLVEDRLSPAISKLWDEIFASPQPDLEALYNKHISSLVNRLNITLSPS